VAHVLLKCEAVVAFVALVSGLHPSDTVVQSARLTFLVCSVLPILRSRC